MTDVLVAATGMVPFRKQSLSSVDVLASDAITKLFSRGKVKRQQIQEVYFGSAKAGGLIGQRAMRFAGMATGLPTFNVENACASSAVAFHLAYRAIHRGDINCALVVGVDKLSSLGKGALPVQETEWEGKAGVTNPVVYALRARRYMHETGAIPEDLAEVVVKARRFAFGNSVAQMRSPVTVQEVLESRRVADPLTLFQCSPKSDGAAAVVLMSRSFAKNLEIDGPVVRASVVNSGVFDLGERDITRPDITLRTAAEAFEMSGIGAEDLDVVELHDAFSIAELLYCEELGLCERGGAVDFLRSGKSASLVDNGRALVNPSGGLIGRGHPIGATGVAQIIEVSRQLRAMSGSRQKEAARLGLAHVTGGGASGFDNGACSVTILSKD